MINKRIGNIGEAEAVAFLKGKGYKIVETNYTNKIGEIDIVAKDKQTLVFVEVKSRSSDMFGLGREAVDFRKQQKIRLVAQGYIKYKKLFDVSCRFDVVEIMGDKITHIENAF